jgi:AcrR family transcriptional regulator
MLRQRRGVRSPSVTDTELGDDFVATDGRTIGRRAQMTRRKLLDSTAKLLDERGALELKVIDIAREAGSSAATFYQYFEDVEVALLALAEEAGSDLGALEQLVAPEWGRKAGFEATRTFVAAFINYWDEHKAILRVRNLRSEEGDQRFRALRLSANDGIMGLFIEKVTAAKESGRLSDEMNTFTTAGAMMAVLERLAAFHVEFERRGVSRTAMVTTIARLLYQTLTGFKPPASTQ